MTTKHLQCCVVMIVVFIVPKIEQKLPPKFKSFQRECHYKTCTKQPNFNEPHKKGGMFCKEHKSPKMVNVHARICLNSTCNKPSRYNISTRKRGIYCREHRLPNMIDVLNPLCKHVDCTTNPIFNYSSLKTGAYCATHFLPGMEDVQSPTCKYKTCKVQPRYNKQGQKKGLYCKTHALEGMEDVVSLRCKNAMCNKTKPIYNEPHLKRGLYCRQHKLVGMEDVVSLRCKHDTCRTFVINTIKHKYLGYCFQHFIQEFPDAPIVRNYKTKELAMSRDISERFPNLIWLDDKRIPGGTSGKRGDKMTDLKTHYIIVECDETQHSSYAKELERMLQLSNDVNQIPIIFIRFNPDAYVDNGKKVRSCWGKTDEGVVKITRQKEWNVRLDCLGREIKSAIRNVPTTPISERYLFYNSKFDESMLCEPCNEY